MRHLTDSHTERNMLMTTAARWNKILRRIAIISAYAATILVPTGWAKLAIVPVALTLIATLASPTMRRLWWAALALAVVYAAPFIQYAVNPDRASSLSKDMDVIWWVIIPLVGVVYIVAYHLSQRVVAERAEPAE